MIRPGEQSESDLLRRVGAGEEEAFRAIFGKFQGPIYRFSLHMSGSTAIAEDVTQEVFMTLIEKSSRFDASRGSLSAYLTGMARNLLLRRFERDRALVALPEGDLPDMAPANGNGHAIHTVPPADFVRGETIGRVRQAVLSLPANYREVVVLCDLEEMSYEEASRILNCAEGTVRSRLHRARALLTEKLREFRQPERRPVAGRHAVP